MDIKEIGLEGNALDSSGSGSFCVHCYEYSSSTQEVLGRTNLRTFRMAMVAIATIAKDCMSCNHNNPTINPKPLMCKAENHANYIQTD
jgi:hypothetical protein